MNGPFFNYIFHIFIFLQLRWLRLITTGSYSHITLIMFLGYLSQPQLKLLRPGNWFSFLLRTVTLVTIETTLTISSIFYIFFSFFISFPFSIKILLFICFQFFISCLFFNLYLLHSLLFFIRSHFLHDSFGRKTFLFY